MEKRNNPSGISAFGIFFLGSVWSWKGQTTFEKEERVKRLKDFRRCNIHMLKYNIECNVTVGWFH
jgi:hypothetical protein